MAEGSNAPPSKGGGNEAAEAQNDTMEDKVYAGGYLDFSYLHAVFLIGAVFTYVADLTLDFILAATYAYDGYYWYCFVTVFLVLVPTVAVQIFSVRWHQMDNMMTKPIWAMHSVMLGVLHRYLLVLNLGLEAMKTGDPVDYQRFYQQQSDVCMLRLFDSFGESAPQLVFHLYVMIVKSHWSVEQAAWTGISALASTISLGWGIAAYSSAMRMLREDKGKMTWMGMILQTMWRFGMLSARIAALVLLSLALHQWAIIVLFVHWLLMTGWVIWQDTDFCVNVWEERLYNAVVGVIYCFCFFNLKEGRSRYRAAIFYAVIVLENFAFLSLFYYFSPINNHVDDASFAYWLSVGACSIVVIGTFLGLSGMLLYYRFFHPAGPIRPCVGESVNFDSDLEELKRNGMLESPLGKKGKHNISTSPDFVITEEDMVTPPRPPPRSRKPVTYSRSFKSHCPPPKRCSPVVGTSSPISIVSSTPDHNVSPLPSGCRERAIDCGMSPIIIMDRVDSAYGTDSNRTGSPPNNQNNQNQAKKDNEDSTEEGQNTSGSSMAFNNDTYMSNNNVSYASVDKSSKSNNNNKSNVSYDSADKSGKSNNTYMSVRAPGETSNQQVEEPEKLLKRSPVVRDVTSGFAHISSTDQCVNRANKKGLVAPLTILVPNISHQSFASRTNKNNEPVTTTELSDKTISLELLNPQLPQNDSHNVPHDYENMALININRAPLGVSHWRTYSDMADGKHDESGAYEKKNRVLNQSNLTNNGSSLHYYDIYPLSKEMKEQLYRSLTPLSTAATMASDTMTNVSESDTYEPIENYQDMRPSTVNESTMTDNTSSSELLTVPVPVTLIHHDGSRLTTRQITSMDSLKEVIQRHEKVPMDSPEDRADLYLLAPMRLLTPIMEEPEHEMTKHTNSTYADFNRSVLTVISEILGNTNKSFMHSTALTSKTNLAVPDTHEVTSAMQQQFPDGHFADSIESTSSLVHTIDEIRNNSLCNLYYTENGQQQNAVPQVPPRNNSSQEALTDDLKKKSLAVIRSNNKNMSVPKDVPSEREVAERRKKSPLYTSVGSRKNLLELAGTTSNILNTPKKLEPLQLTVAVNNVNDDSQFDRSALRPFENSHSLSPSAKYETPTPPLKGNQFVRNTGAYRPRRKFSMIRDKFESPETNRKASNNNNNNARRPMIVAKSNNDLYQNISDDFLMLRNASNVLRRSDNRGRSGGNLDVAKCKSVPSFVDSKHFELLRPDEKYENLQQPQRGHWSTASYQKPPQRNVASRRSMSILDEVPVRAPLDNCKENNKENCLPPKPPHLRPKVKTVETLRGSPRQFRHSLSPQSRIFTTKQ